MYSTHQRYKTYDIPKFVYKYFPEAKLTASGREFLVTCPWHGGDKRKMYINSEKGIFTCFSCGEKGSFYKIIRKMLRLSKIREVNEAAALYESKSYIEASEEPSPSFDPTILYPEGYFPLYEDVGQEGEKAISYLHGRGITDEQIYYYKLGFCLTGPLSGRIFVPVFDLDNRLVSYVARDYTGENKRKVMTPPAAEGTSGVKDYVYNLNNAKFTGHIVITEGVFDAISVGASGVALFGKVPTEKQFKAILDCKPQRITVCLDYDARKENENNAFKFSTMHTDVRLALLPEGDPNSIPKEVLDRTIASAVHYTGWGLHID